MNVINIQLRLIVHSCFQDINIKPATWAKNLIKNRLPGMVNQLRQQQLIFPSKRISKFYSTTLFRHRRFSDLKKLVFIKIIRPVNHMGERIILLGPLCCQAFDWTYQLSIQYCLYIIRLKKIFL